MMGVQRAKFMTAVIESSHMTLSPWKI